jgi:hypothetical protein
MWCRSRRIGHGSPALTLIYAHLLRPDDHAAAVMDLVLKQC